MDKLRFRHAFLVALLIGGIATAARAGGKNSPSEYGKVDFGAQELQFADGCVFVDGKLTSGNFFDDLKRRDTRGRFEFKRSGQTVTDYPDSVTTSIRLVGDQCATALSNSPAAIFSGDSFALKFQLEWKHDMQLRPAALTSALEHCDGYKSIVLPRRDLTVPTIVCEMTVDSRGVPLSDHLIVSVFTSDGTRLTRLSAAP
jgi:hypothetical protein